ncbi:hypothetical protein XELAEV_18030922mg [Xenopus laevis]|uniref:Uncharacterized protein n=1 Tax=Xenopus laevis TaxID=8355 RepID=A0A974CNA4_XENLA|nr:hypothetical protein XELAEV_18030922mg [Xenopus laevis]
MKGQLCETVYLSKLYNLESKLMAQTVSYPLYVHILTKKNLKCGRLGVAELHSSACSLWLWGECCSCSLSIAGGPQVGGQSCNIISLYVLYCVITLKLHPSLSYFLCWD